MSEIENNTGLPESDWKRRLGMEARMYAASEAMNILQLGRVLQEAKNRMPHGEWGAWVAEYTEMSLRTAQQHMQAFAAFGVNAEIAALGKGKIFRLMSVPSDEREKLMETHNVEQMTVREIDETIRQEREEHKRELESEQKARLYAERRLKEIENRPPEVPEDVLDSIREKDETIREQAAELERVAQTGREALEETNRLRESQSAMMRAAKEKDETIRDQALMLEEQQEALNRAQEELLNAKSALARGDADRKIPEQVSAEAFSQAVNSFIGRVARIPQMQTRFACMSAAERRDFDESLRTVEEWARASRRALDTVSASGVIV